MDVLLHSLSDCEFKAYPEEKQSQYWDSNQRSLFATSTAITR